MAPNIRNKKFLPVAAHRQSAGNRAQLGVTQLDGLMIGKITVGKDKTVYGLTTRATAEKLFPIRRKAQAVKGFFNRCSANGSARREIEYDDFVLPVTAMKHRRKFAGGMHGDVYRKITEYDLFSRRP